jgi:hypothetical protein
LLRRLIVGRNDRLKTSIHTAFSELPVPESIIEITGGDTETREMLRAALGERRWSQIPSDVLCTHHDALFFLSPPGLRYLLPAFVIASLERPEMHLVEALVLALTKPEEPSDERRFLEAMSPLSETQRAAVISFLEYLREEEPQNWPDDEPGKALRSFWKPASDR